MRYFCFLLLCVLLLLIDSFNYSQQLSSDDDDYVPALLLTTNDDTSPTIKDDKAATEDDDTSVKSDGAPCVSCRRQEGTNQFFPNCQKGEFLICDDCEDKMPDEVKMRRWCGLCRTCHFGKVKVKLGKKPRKGKKAKLTTCGRNCKSSEDIRGRCEINCKAKNSLDQFLACPARVDTTAWTIANEYGLYKLAEQGDYTYLDQFDFTDEDKIAIIVSYNVDR